MKQRYMAGVFTGAISLFGLILPWFVIPGIESINAIDLIWKYNLGAIAYLMIVIFVLIFLFAVQIKRVSVCIGVSIIGLYINGRIIFSITQYIPESLNWIIGVGPGIVSLGFILAIVVSIYIDIINNREEREALHRKMREDYLKEKEMREIEEEIREIEGSLPEHSYVVSGRVKRKKHRKKSPEMYRKIKSEIDEDDDFDIDLTIPEEGTEDHYAEDFMFDDENMDEEEIEFPAKEKDERKPKKKRAVAKLCPNCGKKIPLNSKFCPYCGYVFKK